MLVVHILETVFLVSIGRRFRSPGRIGGKIDANRPLVSSHFERPFYHDGWWMIYDAWSRMVWLCWRWQGWIWPLHTIVVTTCHRNRMNFYCWNVQCCFTASKSKLTSMWGTPRGAGGIPTTSNSPSLVVPWCVPLVSYLLPWKMCVVS